MLEWLLSLLLPIPLANSITLSRETYYIFSTLRHFCPLFLTIVSLRLVNIIDRLRDTEHPYRESRRWKESHFASTLFQAAESFCKKRGGKENYFLKKGRSGERKGKIWSWNKQAPNLCVSLRHTKRWMCSPSGVDLLTSKNTPVSYGEVFPMGSKNCCNIMVHRLTYDSRSPWLEFHPFSLTSPSDHLLSSQGSCKDYKHMKQRKAQYRCHELGTGFTFLTNYRPSCTTIWLYGVGWGWKSLAVVW